MGSFQMPRKNVANVNVTVNSYWFFSGSRSSLEHTNLTKQQATTKTMDSGIESIGQHLSEDRGFSTDSSPEPASTGNEHIDASLMFHVIYCERLLEVSILVLDRSESTYLYMCI